MVHHGENDMNRLQQARIRQEKERQLQCKLQLVLDELVETCPGGQTRALLAIIEYAVTGLAAVRRPWSTRDALDYVERCSRKQELL